tara:strand:- start:1315 stop:1560 length:246 start_codon:yes stop_codon:yes gene_type:complete
LENLTKKFIKVIEMTVRHPEKINNPINPIKKKPNWIRARITDTQDYFKTKKLLTQKNFILFVKRLAALIFQNAGTKDMQRL